MPLLCFVLSFERDAISSSFWVLAILSNYLIRAYCGMRQGQVTHDIKYTPSYRPHLFIKLPAFINNY